MIVVRAPFRVPIGGGGTDLPSYYSKYEGEFISAAIDKYMFISVNKPVVDKLIRVKYTETEIVESLDQIKHDLVRETLRLTNIDNSIEINSIADLPAGVGMGSSGSYLVALLKALHTLKRENISTQELAEEACTIEIDNLSRAVGKQDQYIAAYGGLTKFKIDKKGQVSIKPIDVPQSFIKDFDASLIIFYTGIRREGSQILAKQNKATKNNDKRVVDNLHQIKQIGLEIEEAILAQDIELIGRLMHKHWETKRKLSSSISSNRIDYLYGLGIKNGAMGGKIMGAGGGGFLLFCCPGEKKNIRAAMEKEGLTELFFNFDMEGVKVVANLN